MSSIIRVITHTFRDTTIGTLSLSVNATNIIEKICWLFIWLLGSILTSMFINEQIESWKRNPIIASRLWVDLSEIPYPAITFCHQGNTRMEAVERLLEAADESSPKIRHFRSWLLEKSVDQLVHSGSNPFSSSFSQNEYLISSKYGRYCQHSTRYNMSAGNASL